MRSVKVLAEPIAETTASTIDDPNESAAAILEARKLLNSIPPGVKSDPPVRIASPPSSAALGSIPPATPAKSGPGMTVYAAIAAVLLLAAIAYFASR